MPQDIEDAVVFALAQKGKPYRTNSERFGDAAFDCSGLVIRSLAEAGIPLPNGISVEKKWGNSVSLWRWAKDVGGLVTVERAVRIRGAILIRGRWYGNGPLGDVKFSLGDGRQTGAGSRRTGVATTDVRQGFFHDGFIIPGVHYAALEPPVTPEMLEAIKRLVDWGVRVTATPLRQDEVNRDVTILNLLLIERGLLATSAPMNLYSKQTRDAVVHFKKLAKLSNRVGKVFGGEAVAAILHPR